MKGKIDIARELHDDLLGRLVRLELDVQYSRLVGKDKEKSWSMKDREEIETRLALLREYMHELVCTNKV